MDPLCNATSTRSSWPFSKQTGASPVTSDVIGSGSAALVGLGGGTLLHCPPGARPDFAGMPSAMPNCQCTEVFFGTLSHEIYS